MTFDFLAQAGGGGNYGGGGSGGSGGGGGGGGDGGGGALIFWLIQFTIRYPQFGIPLCILIVVAIYFGKKAESNHRVTRTIRRGRKAQEQQLLSAAMNAIQTRDPAFTEDTFLKRVAHSFASTQSAWSEQNLQSCRAFISDGVRERFELYIAMQKKENIRNRMREVRVSRSTIVAVSSDQHFDTIHVRITAHAISYNEDLTTGKRVSGGSDRQPMTFTEVWSFSRRPGAQTNSRASSLEGRCPNCGATLEIVDRAECTSCQSIVNSGQHDWVLAEITQDEEWVLPREQVNLPGWAALQSDDPGLNVQHLEDRASVMFWRSMMAVYFEDIRYAKPVLDAGTVEVPRLWNPGVGHFWKTPAVGVVEVVACSPAGDDEFDRVLVMVRWSATEASGDRRKPKRHGQQRIHTHVLVLKRLRGVTSQADQTFTSFSCTGCGASVDRSGAATCRYCGAVLNDGSGNWVLEDVVRTQSADTFGVVAAPQASQGTDGEERLERNRLANSPELLRALCQVLAVDGELHGKERAYLMNFARERGISKARLKAVFAEVQTGDNQIALPTEPAQSRQFMMQPMRAALIDGRIDKSEYDLLLMTGRNVGWSHSDVKHAIAKTRGALYREARAAVRNAKSAVTSG